MRIAWKVRLAGWPATEPVGGGNRVPDRVDQLRCGLERAPRDDLARDRAGVALLAELLAGSPRCGPPASRSPRRGPRSPVSDPSACRAARRRSRRSRAPRRRAASRRRPGPCRRRPPASPSARERGQDVREVAVDEGRRAGELGLELRRSARGPRDRGRSRSSEPVGPSRSATRRACPPPPKVQSTASSPGCGSHEGDELGCEDWDVLGGHVGECVHPQSSSAVGQSPAASSSAYGPDLGVHRGGLLGPALGAPDLEVGLGADDHAGARKVAVLDQVLGDLHPAGGVELLVLRARVMWRRIMRGLPPSGVEASPGPWRGTRRSPARDGSRCTGRRKRRRRRPRRAARGASTESSADPWRRGCAHADRGRPRCS